MATTNLGLNQPAMSDRVADTIPALAKNFGIIDALMPVGFILQTTKADFNPATQYPGTTWTQLHDVFLCAAGSHFSGGSTGGSDNHKHLTSMGFDTDHIYLWYTPDSPSVNTGVPHYGSVVQTDRTISVDVSTGLYGQQRMAYTESVSNLPPYKVVYMWERTS